MSKTNATYNFWGRHVIGIIIMLVMVYADANAQNSRDLRIKSAYIEKLSKFVKWPNDSLLKKGDKPFVIGVVGNKAFIEVLRKDYSRRQIKEKWVSVIEVNSSNDIKLCNLIFIKKIDNKLLNRYLKEAHRNNVLTMSDNFGFGEKGVFINFFENDNNIRFELNLEAMKGAKFEVVALLIEIAKVVATKD